MHSQQNSDALQAHKSALTSKYNKHVLKISLAAFSAAIAETLTFPFDLTKTRLQIQGEQSGRGHKGARRGMVGVGLGVIREEGFFKLWRGLTPAVVRHLFYTSLRVSSYEYLRENVLKKNADGHFPLHKSILASLMAGVIGQFIVTPMDLIKVRCQMDGRRELEGLRPRYRGLSHAVATITREEGLLKLWRGVVPSCQRAALVTLGDLATYDKAKRLILRYTDLKDNSLTHVLSSVCAGLSATTLGRLCTIIPSVWFYLILA